MTGRRTLGVSMLCALVVCALTASSAFAAGGTTLVTCKSGGTTKDFSKAHCEEADHGINGSGTFSHFKVANGVTTTVTGTNTGLGSTTEQTIPAVLTATNAGIETEISCSSVSATGEESNSEPTAENHKITGTNTIVSYTGCTVPKPAGQECKVKEGKITTNSLKATDKEMAIEFTPTEGTTFTPIVLEGCKTAGLNGTKNVTGSVLGTPNGSTLAITIEKVAGSTLQFGGQPAGLHQTLTVKGKKKGGSEAAEPLSVTTTPLNLGG